MSSVPNNLLKRHGWDLLAAALLLYAAYLLSHVNAHLYAFGGYGYGWRRYEEGAYFERLRLVVCVAWVLAAVRFYNFKWVPIAIFGLIIAWLFNPIVPVTMSRFRWQPYDRWTMWLSIAAAIFLAIRSYSNRITRHAESSPEPLK